jgi:hypothetical protein
MALVAGCNQTLISSQRSSPSKQLGAGVHFGTGFNRNLNVHIDDLVDLYLLALEKLPERRLSWRRLQRLMLSG